MPDHAGRTGRRRWPVAVVVLASLLAAAIAAVVLLGRDSQHDGGSDVAAASSHSATVTVTRSDITPVITLDATVTPQPSYSVVAPRGGVVAPMAQAGQEVAARSPLFSVDGAPVAAPAGCVVQKWLIRKVRVPAGLPVVSCAYPGFGLTASFPPDGAYRLLSGTLTGRGQITDGPAPFDCPILSVPFGSAADAQTLGVVCAVPAGVRCIAGVGALMAIHSTLVHDVLVLPKSAVAGSVDTGLVNLISHGRQEQRAVKLGATDGNVVQIVSGLHDGDRVSAKPPSLGS